MQIQSLKLVCFSPTGTTKAVIQSIANGIDSTFVELIDITQPDARKTHLQTNDKELLIVAVPVYMGRVPLLLTEWLHEMKAHNTPTVCVVVYGNREYDDALLELKDIVKSRGGIPVAGAAYIGEHSFSSPQTPTGEGRPDGNDMSHAEAFGRKIHEKLLSVSSLDQIPEIAIPGNYPYGGTTELWSVDFLAIGTECRQCGICAQVCPVGAIDPERSDVIDTEKCVTCCACIKTCPQSARSMKAGPVKDAAIRLSTLCIERKEPVCFV